MFMMRFLGRRTVIAAFVFAWAGVSFQFAIAQEATAIRMAVEAGVAKIFSTASQQATKQLVEMGGRESVEGILREAAKEGGETMVKKTVGYAIEEGPAALNVIRRAPKQVLEVLDKTPADLRSGLVAALERTPSSLATIEKLGQPAVRAITKFPGAGDVLVSKLGAEGAEAALAVDENAAIILARNAGDIAALPAAERATFWTAFKKAPGKVVEMLERSPNMLKAAVAVAGILAINNAVNDAVVHIVDKTPTLTGKPDPTTGEGFLDRLFRPVVYAVAAVIGIWGAVKAYGSWQSGRARQRKSG